MKLTSIFRLLLTRLLGNTVLTFLQHWKYTMNTNDLLLVHKLNYEDFFFDEAEKHWRNESHSSLQELMFPSVRSIHADTISYCPLQPVLSIMDWSFTTAGLHFSQDRFGI